MDSGDGGVVDGDGGVMLMHAVMMYDVHHRMHHVYLQHIHRLHIHLRHSHLQHYQLLHDQTVHAPMMSSCPPQHQGVKHSERKTMGIRLVTMSRRGWG